MCQGLKKNTRLTLQYVLWMFFLTFSFNCIRLLILHIHLIASLLVSFSSECLRCLGLNLALGQCFPLVYSACPICLCSSLSSSAFSPSPPCKRSASPLFLTPLCCQCFCLPCVDGLARRSSILREREVGYQEQDREIHHGIDLLLPSSLIETVTSA